MMKMKKKTNMMSMMMMMFIITIFFLIQSSSSSSSTSSDDEPETFIVHVSESAKPSLFTSHHDWYSSTLKSLPPSSSHPTKILYTYNNHAISGFSARLTPSQASHLRRLPGILSILPDQIRQIHTTRTPQFLGLADTFGLWPNSDYADDVIVGVLDSGIWPERPSFDDSGLSPVPAKFKGICEIGPHFPASSCNRKIVGARAFYKGYEEAIRRPMDETEDSKSPRDTDGHGTHTASTAAGSVVRNAGFYQYAKGEARGMATKARIAVYKICWSKGCYDSDILAAMDQAVADGVDVISLSVGANNAPHYDRDSVAIGAFRAVGKGVIVSCSAGNSGPGPSTLENIAPWVLTVGASTIDREFSADVVLGDGRIFRGASTYPGEPLEKSDVELVDGGDIGSEFCYEGELDSSKAAGKIVICSRTVPRVALGNAVKVAGGVGMIVANTEQYGEELLADAHLIPATQVGWIAGNRIREYVRNQPSPTATIRFGGTVIGGSPSSPKVAALSSRGPNHLTPEILKPDVIAPGVNILAAWTGAAAPSGLFNDPRRTEFNIMSGTSMSCPHVSGLAALLRKAYPNWTPAAIKSALITTAYNLDNSGKNITDLATGEASTPFARGAGHVDPNRALNPGLVYDIGVSDYVAFLCSIGYNSSQIFVFVKDHEVVDCSSNGLAGPGDLNYPSFSVVFGSGSDTVKYKRVVKNVGSSVNAVYEAKITSPSSVKISVSPSKLEFSEENQSLAYEITFTSLINEEMGLSDGTKSPEFGSIEWSDGLHVVRSPIAIRWGITSSWTSMIMPDCFFCLIMMMGLILINA